MKRVATRLLVTEAVAMALVVVSLLSTVTSNRSSLLPGPVTWAVIVLAALVLVASAIELVRRKSHRSSH